MENWRGGVWGVVDRQDAFTATGKPPLKGRWVDCNKGDKESVDVRSRWVAKEVATYRTDAFYAATPTARSEQDALLPFCTAP